MVDKDPKKTPKAYQEKREDKYRKALKVGSELQEKKSEILKDLEVINSQLGQLKPKVKDERDNALMTEFNKLVGKVFVNNQNEGGNTHQDYIAVKSIDGHGESAVFSVVQVGFTCGKSGKPANCSLVYFKLKPSPEYVKNAILPEQINLEDPRELIENLPKESKEIPMAEFDKIVKNFPEVPALTEK